MAWRDYTLARRRNEIVSCQECNDDEAVTQDGEGRPVCGFCADKLEERANAAAQEAAADLQNRLRLARAM